MLLYLAQEHSKSIKEFYWQISTKIASPVKSYKVTEEIDGFRTMVSHYENRRHSTAYKGKTPKSTKHNHKEMIAVWIVKKKGYKGHTPLIPASRLLWIQPGLHREF